MAEEQLACLKPYTNAVRDAQDAGALGVVIGNTGNATVTMVQTAVPFEVKIPVFNLAAGAGVAFSQALLDNKVGLVQLESS
jgi:Na+-translocating ferredoxin:NAD+ oxidoreductase RnfE subunit